MALRSVEKPLWLPSQPGILRQYASTLHWLRQAADVAVALAVLYGVTLIKLGGRFPEFYQVLAIVIALTMVIVYQWTGVYHTLRLSSIWLEARGLLKAWAAVLMILFALGFATKTSQLYSREALFYWTLLGYAGQLTLHGLVHTGLRLLRERGHYIRKALLVGGGQAARQFSTRLARNPWLGIKVLGYVGDDPCSPIPGEDAREPPMTCLGSLSALTQVVRKQGVEVVYITLPLADSHYIENVMRWLMPLHVDIHWVPDMSAFHLINHSVREIEGQPVLSLSDSPVRGMARVSKWVEDKAVAALVLVLFSPFMLVVALAVKLSSPGPVLFKQVRAGLNGKPINIYKFRTMRLHAETQGTVTQATRDDPRVTGVGRILRATSLDELPQFYNVLQGRMSIVGPRPHALEHDGYYEKQIDTYMLRHRIKPGITGWAQVNGYRGEIDRIEKMSNRVKYDLYYINNWSLWFDMVIIFMTVWVVVTGKNAY